MLLLGDSFQLPLEALQCSRSLISSNRWLAVVAVTRVHQDADILEFFLDQSEIITQQSFLFARERVSINRSGHVDEILLDLAMVLYQYGVLDGPLRVQRRICPMRTGSPSWEVSRRTAEIGVRMGWAHHGAESGGTMLRSALAPDGFRDRLGHWRSDVGGCAVAVVSGGSHHNRSCDNRRRGFAA